MVTASGIKPENVILLAVDDIANYRTNPFPGQVFNKPTDAGTPGVDVYDGCVIDYKGTDVTPETFTKVLTGDDSAGGKVLKSARTTASSSTSSTTAPSTHRLPHFPDARDRAPRGAAEDARREHVQGARLLSRGVRVRSMFANLPANMNIYATTAANGKESSWGTCVCVTTRSTARRSTRASATSTRSTGWRTPTRMASEVTARRPRPARPAAPLLLHPLYPAPLPSPQTLEAQFNTVKTETAKSHVMMYGDATIDAEVVSNFQGTTDSAAATKGAARQLFEAPKLKHASTDLKSADAEIASAFSRFMHLDFDDEAAEELSAGIRTAARRRRASRRW